MQQIAIDEQHREAVVNSRSIFVTAVEDEERIRFPEEVLLIQLIATELQHHRLLIESKPKIKHYGIYCAEMLITVAVDTIKNTPQTHKWCISQ